jgi:predicted component of type VI protein secretion system
MTADEQAAAINQMINAFASMKAFEIMEVAKSLGRLDDLLGAKSTISALLAELNNHKREEAR